MKILVAGDFCPTERLKPIVESGDYNSIFCEVEPIIKSADYSIVNYECPAVLGDYPPIAKCGPNLSSSPKGIEAIKYAGFNIATLANNHIMDFGAQGLMDTVNLCSQYNIDPVGVGKNLEDASKILYKKKSGDTLAIINCCEHEFSIAGNASPGANPLNPIQQYYKIKEARQNADYVLVIVHGGHEHYQLPSPRMVEIYRFFIDAGADAVVNHHQHCFSGYEVYNDRPIFYGLGNFCFDRENSTSLWHEGFMLELNFRKHERVEYVCYPYTQCCSNAKISVLRKQDDWIRKIKELNAIITDMGLLQAKCEEFYDGRKQSIDLMLGPYRGRLFIKLYLMRLLPSLMDKAKILQIQNYINCESHLDVLRRCLRVCDNHRDRF